MAGGRTITQRIALVGGEAIKATLEGIGTAGATAFSRLSAAADTGSTFNKFGGHLDSVRQKMTQLGEIGRGVGDRMTNVAESVGRAGERLGIVAGVSLVGAARKLLEVATSAGEAQESLDNNAAAVGVSAKELDQFQKIAGLAGVSQEQLQKTLLKVNQAVSQQSKEDRAAAKAKSDLFKQVQRGEISNEQYIKSIQKLNEAARESDNIFDRLGISTKKADGSLKDSITIFREAGQALAQVENGTKRSGLAMELFGSRNAKLTSLSVLNREEFEAQRREIERLTPALSDAERNGLAKFGDRLELLGKASTTVRDKLFAVFAPELTRIVDEITERVAASREVFLEYARDLLEKVKPIVDDVVAAIAGRDLDVKNPAILQFKEQLIQGLKDIGAAVVIVANGFKALLATLEVVAGGINAVFGTKLTGGTLLATAALLKLSGLFGVVTSVGRLVVFTITSIATAFGVWPILLAAAGVAIGFLIVTLAMKLPAAFKALGTWAANTWASITSGVGAVGTAIANGFKAGIDAVVAYFASFPGNVVLIWNAITAGAAALWTTIKQLFAQGVQALADTFPNLAAGITTVWNNIVQFFSTAWEGLKQLFNDGVTAIGDVWATLTQRISDIWNGILAYIQGIWAQLKQATSDLADQVVAYFTGGFDKIKNAATDMWNWIKGKWDGLIQKAKEYLKLQNEASGDGGGPPAAQNNAAGGHIRGAGTGTSDSILSWLSNGEYVVRAAAVRKFGVGFFNKLNNLRQPGFASGGLVNLASAALPPIPRFASGGLATAPAGGAGGRPFTLNIGGETFGGLTASGDTVERLQKYAVRKAVRSAGRKPNWHNG